MIHANSPSLPSELPSSLSLSLYLPSSLFLFLPFFLPSFLPSFLHSFLPTSLPLCLPPNSRAPSLPPSVCLTVQYIFKLFHFLTDFIQINVEKVKKWKNWERKVGIKDEMRIH